MKYSTGTIVKAVLAAITALLGAASAAANGPDLSHLDFAQWLASFGTALVAGTALLHTPSSASTPEDAAPAVDPAATVVEVLAKTAAAHSALTDQAVANIAKVQAAVGDLAKLLPAPIQQAASAGNAVLTDAGLAAQAVSELGRLGPLASQVIGLGSRF